MDEGKDWKQRTLQIALIALLVGVIAVLIWLAYALSFGWTGFLASGTPGSQGYQPEKTLWDWLQLLIVPAVLALGALWFNNQQSQRQDKESKEQHKADEDLAEKHRQADIELAQDQQREAALQKYFDDMSDLLLNHQLRESENDEVRQIARSRTLTLLLRLDGRRKGSVLQFLYGARLIDKDKRIVDLNGADFKEAYLWYVHLSGADLSGVNLQEAAISEADLSEANLSGATLQGVILTLGNKLIGVNFSGADLKSVHLMGGDLTGVNLTKADLMWAHLNKTNLTGVNLKGANLSYADLRLSYLNGANLEEANLGTANLDWTNLTGAIITDEQLKEAASLKGATMPDGSKYP